MIRCVANTTPCILLPHILSSFFYSCTSSVAFCIIEFNFADTYYKVWHSHWSYFCYKPCLMLWARIWVIVLWVLQDRVCKVTANSRDTIIPAEFSCSLYSFRAAESEGPVTGVLIIPQKLVLIKKYFIFLGHIVLLCYHSLNKARVK